MRTRTVKQDLILKARTRLRHDKHNDTHEGLKFRKAIRKKIAVAQMGYRTAETNFFRAFLDYG